jgi:hypothetical protein
MRIMTTAPNPLTPPIDTVFTNTHM